MRKFSKTTNLKIHEEAKYSQDNQLLKKIAKNSFYLIRQSLAKNINLGDSLQRKLAQDEHVRVRQQLAGNLKLNKHAQCLLAKDISIFSGARHILACHPNLTIEAQLSLLESSRHDSDIMLKLVTNTNVDLEIFSELCLEHQEFILLRYNMGYVWYRDSRIYRKIDLMNLLK